jgi:PPM family protein phosphatase
MTACPTCGTPNRTGARYCRNCGTSLPEIKMGTRPLSTPEKPANKPESVKPKSTVKLQESQPKSTIKLASGRGQGRTNTQPLSRGQVFDPRPGRAVFGDQFVMERLIFSDERQNRYIVVQTGASADSGQISSDLIRLCQNPTCGAVFVPTVNGQIRFCTDCNTALGEGVPSLVLVETLAPLYPNVDELTALSLAHGSVRPPLVSFSELLVNTTRYCVVLPEVQPFNNRPEPSKAMEWGTSLARGLNYLHANGISYNGQVNDNCFGLVGDRPVWVNFVNSAYSPDMIGQAQPQDVYALAMLIFQWVTGRTQPGYDPNLPASINGLFEKALSAPGIATGEDLAQAIEHAVEEVATLVSVDFRVGRRTNVGRQRTLNEDSLLAIDMTRVTKSMSLPVGVFVVADGMGGHAAGEVASGTIVSTISELVSTELFQTNQTNLAGSQSPAKLDPAQWVRHAVETANRVVFDMRKSAGTDMGSTLVMALVEGNKAYVTNVGDSRAYRINANGIQQITTDHSLVQRLIATNQITPEEARHHPQRNVIYRTIGDKPKVDLDILTPTFSIGERLLLCSDGLSGMVEDAYLYKIVMEAPSPQAACDHLIDAANAAGGEDNISVIVVEVAAS